MTGKKVLFISHDALRTGAPIFLSNFLGWFRNNTAIPFRILLKNGGELESEFKALAPVSVFNGHRPSGNVWYERMARITGFRVFKTRHHFRTLRKELLQDNIGLVYSNTITNGAVLEFLSCLKCPIVTHVHELEYWIYRSGSENFDLVKNYTDRYIVVSEAVKQNLVCNHDIREDKIDVVHGFIPLSALKCEPDSNNNLRKSLSIPEDAVIVGSSGMDSWRKGKDLFVQLALSVIRKYREKPVHFVWVGGRKDGLEFYELEHDVRHAGISDRVHFVDHVSNPLDYYREFDIFAMISREDPFPLVNLEVAGLGKPIICFDDAGGTPEFVESDAGFVVPYLDINAMADRVVLLAGDEELRKKLGGRSFEKIMTNYDISIGASKILEIIERFL